MNPSIPRRAKDRGYTLVETVIAIGVLAVAIPWVFGALAESAKSEMTAAAETRAPWMIATCMAEIQASRDGRPQFFTPTATHQTFPTAGDVWALGFSPEGLPIGKLQPAEYDRGIDRLKGHPVRYIACLNSTEADKDHGLTFMLRANIAIEYPASSPATKRRRIDFNTRIP